MNDDLRLGAIVLGGSQCQFRVWAPTAESVELFILSPEERVIPLARDEWGYHHRVLDSASPGTRYVYRLDGTKDRPDPASRSQPEGVHGPSEVVDLAFPWKDDDWAGLALERYVVYELHVGTFTPEGTFGAVIPRLNTLKDLGVTAIELMPVAQCPGNRNWGYDGVYPFAVQTSYGGAKGLKRLVDACHSQGLAVVLDVVYNHLGPEGNYFSDFGPYFTDRYKTQWGSAVNFDGAFSDGVRHFFVENALEWIREYHVDALRIDAVHAIFDFSAEPFLQELATAVHRKAGCLDRHVHIIAESDLNDSRIVRSPQRGGFGLDAQWNEDFHHALHTLLTGERDGYYVDYGRSEHFVKALSEGFVYSGEYSTYRRRRHGNSSRDIPAEQFVAFSQNHDQVGNRMCGERLSTLVPYEALKLAAGAVIFSPYIPLLFMGEEYGEESPFLYFVDHSDPGLVRTVREGRREEFKAFAWKGTPPDLDSKATFAGSKLHWDLRQTGKHGTLWCFYQHLLTLRRETEALSRLDNRSMEVTSLENDVIGMRRWHHESCVFTVFNFSYRDQMCLMRFPEGTWRKIVDSADERWLGPGSGMPERVNGPAEAVIRALSLTCYEKESSL